MRSFKYDKLFIIIPEYLKLYFYWDFWSLLTIIAEKFVDSKQDKILYETIVSTPKFRLDNIVKHCYSSLVKRPGIIDKGFIVDIKS